MKLKMRDNNIRNLSHLIIKLSAAIVCLVFFGNQTHAQDIKGGVNSRPVTGTYSFEVGRTSVLATYLSPLKYTGTSLGISGNWLKALPFNPQHAIMEFNLQSSIASMLNPAHSAKMIGIIGDFSWGIAWRKKILCDIQFAAGGAIHLAGGAYYLIRNSNNPVQAIANGSLDITALISRHFKIGKLPVLIADNIKIPSIGLFFCPQYGETYFEIYLGNHKGLIHPSWWGNNFRIDNLLSVTLDFGKTAMTLGYRFNIYSQCANNLNTKIFNNYFVIGVVPGGIGLKKKTKILPETTIYSIY